MKSFLIVFVLSLFMLACKPDTKAREVMHDKTDVTNNDQDSMQEKEHIAEIRLSVPDSTWSLKIVNVTQTAGELAVVCQLMQSDMMGLMVISEVVDAVKFTAKDLPIKYYIKGKTWNWENQEGYTFMDDESNFHIRNGEPIVFENIEPTTKDGPKKQPDSMPL